MRILLLVVAMLIGHGHAQGCDICGCSAQGSSLGLLPGVSSHFVGVRYHYRFFESLHPPIYSASGDDRSEDYFSTAELWGRVVLHPRLELFAFVPINHYRAHHYTESGYSHASSSSGLGDVSILLNVVLLRTADRNPEKKVQHQWQVGSGLKAPTGKFGQVDSELGIILPNMQSGTGSWDFSAMSNYRLQSKNWGLNVNAAYRYNTTNSLRYQFGQSILATADVLHVFALNDEKTQIIPQLGGRFEFFDRDYSNHSKRQRNLYSGGYFMYASAACDVYAGSFGFQIRADIPVSQDFAQGFVQNRWRMTGGLIYLFNRKN